LLFEEQTLKTALVEIEQDSPLYPKAWLDLPDRPERIYALGDTSLLKDKKFGIVGSRRTPSSALKTGESIAKTLSEYFTVVTGTADGGDTAAIEGALAGTGKILCLLAGGFSSYPRSQQFLLERAAERGLLLAVYPYETEVRAFSYEYRNKLLAALCEGILVLGAGEKSGALITAKYAKEQNKPVFALPYPPSSAAGVGCNGLIKRGGCLTETAQDVLEVFGITSTQKVKPTLAGDEAKVYEVLSQSVEAHVSELSTATGIPVFKLRAILSALEVKGCAASLGGNRYGVV